MSGAEPVRRSRETYRDKSLPIDAATGLRMATWGMLESRRPLVFTRELMEAAVVEQAGALPEALPMWFGTPHASESARNRRQTELRAQGLCDVSLLAHGRASVEAAKANTRRLGEADPVSFAIQRFCTDSNGQYIPAWQRAPAAFPCLCASLLLKGRAAVMPPWRQGLLHAANTYALSVTTLHDRARAPLTSAEVAAALFGSVAFGTAASLLVCKWAEIEYKVMHTRRRKLMLGVRQAFLLMMAQMGASVVANIPSWFPINSSGVRVFDVLGDVQESSLVAGADTAVLSAFHRFPIFLFMLPSAAAYAHGLRQRVLLGPLPVAAAICCSYPSTVLSTVCYEQSDGCYAYSGF